MSLTQTKTQTSVKTKVAVGMITAGIAVVAAALVFGGASAKVSMQLIPISANEVVDNSFGTTIASIVLKAGQKDILVTKIPIEISLSSSASGEIGDLVKNLNLETTGYVCYQEHYSGSGYGYSGGSYGYNNGNQSKGGKYFCETVLSYGYPRMEQIGFAGRVSQKLPTQAGDVISLSHKLIIPAGQARTINIKVDLGNFKGKENKIKVYFGSSSKFGIEYTDGSKAQASITAQHKWIKIKPSSQSKLLPDLIIERAVVSRITNNSARAIISIKNTGEADANFKKIPLSFAISNNGVVFSPIVFNELNLNLKKNQGKVLTFTFKSVSGANQLKFTVDGQNAMEESNENNNSYSKIADF
ncbi:MAG: CARDB domain-containing protein [bacterium]